MFGVTFPVEKAPPYVPPDVDVVACLRAAKGEKGLFLRFLAETAARRGEARRLRLVDIEPDRGLVVLSTPVKKEAGI